MPGVRAFSGTQLGLEATAGTAVAATEILRMPVIFPEDARKMNFPKEDVAIAGGTDRSTVVSLLADLAFPKTVASFEQLPYFFTLGIKNVTTGAADGPGSDKIYAYPVPTSAAPAVKTGTLEGFDDQQCYKAEYCVFSEIKLSGKFNEEVMVEGKAFGRQVQTATKTAALTLPTIEDILFNKGKLFIDAIGGTYGATQKTNTFLGFELEIKTGQKPQPTGDGNLYFSFNKFVGSLFNVKGKVTFEHDASDVAQFALFQAQTPQKMRILFEGSSVATPGTAWQKKTLALDMPFKWTKFPRPTESDGNNVVTAEFDSNYNATALGATFTIVNERATL